MKTIAIFLTLIFSAFGQLAQQQPTTHTVSGNFPRDLYGPVDNRMAGCVVVGPCIWGNADYATATIQFYPPTGYRVKILCIRGDLISWIKTLPGDQPTPPESKAGTLAGFEPPASTGSAQCNYCADNVPVYIQDTVSEKHPDSRAPYNYDNVDLMLGPENQLVAKIAEFLNTTTKAIHLEITYTIKFCYVPVRQ